MELQGNQSTSSVGVSVERETEVREVVERVTRWAEKRSDVAGALLVGSYARGAARPDSDVDLVVLTTQPSRYAEDEEWVRELALGEVVRVQAWGPVTEWRHVTASGLEVEVGIGPTDWARTDPLDAGTRRVVMDGARLLYDPAGVLATLIRACS
ncbi:nucleotidyltransferase domain-containing protein [Streptomyces sp. NPDC013178]|uniref:nucleotidyltransferase domain-containing protein n=1 Tax=Streptomyces sp. NPDC013178 TaxID=3155118 RepID=UPI00340AE6A3